MAKTNPMSICSVMRRRSRHPRWGIGGCHAHGEEQIVGERWVVIAGELDGVGAEVVVRHQVVDRIGGRDRQPTGEHHGHVTAEIHPVDVVPAIWEAFGNANKAVTSAANAK